MCWKLSLKFFNKILKRATHGPLLCPLRGTSYRQNVERTQQSDDPPKGRILSAPSSQASASFFSSRATAAAWARRRRMFLTWLQRCSKHTTLAKRQIYIQHVFLCGVKMKYPGRLLREAVCPSHHVLISHVLQPKSLKRERRENE